MSVCVALVMQRAKRMRRIILSSVASSFVQYFFFTLCCERHDFRGEGGGQILNVKCVLISSTIFVRNVSHSKKISAGYVKKNNVGLRVKHPQFLSHFSEP